MDWSCHFPDFFAPEPAKNSSETDQPCVEFADIGCGYGGLLGRSSVDFFHNSQGATKPLSAAQGKWVLVQGKQVSLTTCLPDK